MEKTSLLELINIELDEFPNYLTTQYKSIEDFITDDKKSADFINNLVFNGESVFNVNKISQGRARHSVLSLFLGLTIGKFDSLFGNLSSSLNDTNLIYLYEINEPYINYWLWMLTSTNHDYGYHSSYLSNNINLENLKLKYFLLDDSKIVDDYTPLQNYETKYPKVLKLSYETIKNYFNYSKEFHKKNINDIEACDHGILGGCLIFDRAIAKILSNSIKSIKNYSMNDMNRDYSYKDILYYKTACLTIAQHNIFKSNSKTSDKEYIKFNLIQLLSNSNYYIDNDTPILALLSLVDTIECIKKFSKSETSKNYLQTITILKLIKVQVEKKLLIFDYNDLFIEIKKRNSIELENIYNDYINNILSINTWMQYNASINNNVITIIHK